MAKFTTTISCIESMIATLKASTNLAAVVSALHSEKHLRFWLGYDEQVLPELAHAPLAIIMPGPFGRNSDRFMQTHSIHIALVIEAGDAKEELGVTRYSGLAKIEGLARAFDDALETWIEDNFAGNHLKTPFATSLQIPSVRTVWQYDFQDQL